MAKKKNLPKGDMDASSDGWLTCVGYTLNIENDQGPFHFQLTTSDGYHRGIQGPDSDVATTKKVLRAIADKWPSYRFEFKADNNKTITDAR